MESIIEVSARDPGSAFLTSLIRFGVPDAADEGQGRLRDRRAGEGVVEAVSVEGRHQRRVLVGGDATPQQLCEMARRATGMAGTGIMLSSGGRPVCSAWSGEVGRLLEDLQYTMGEGPSLDACRFGRPVLEPDLADPDAPRWLALTGSALDAGVGAVFAFPLPLANSSLGALGLYAGRPGPLGGGRHAWALMMAEAAAKAVMRTTWPSTGADRIDDCGWDFRTVVNQAAGMVAAQLGIDVDDASVLLRAHAVGTDRPVVEVADEVIARRLRFGDRIQPS